MSKVRTYIFLVIGIIFISGCNLFEPDKLSLEMVAFNSLTKEEQDKIPVSPKDSVVDEVMVSEELAEIFGDKFIGKSIYSVTFNNTEDKTNGRLVVYINKDKENVIGKGYEQKR